MIGARLRAWVDLPVVPVAMNADRKSENFGNVAHLCWEISIPSLRYKPREVRTVDDLSRVAHLSNCQLIN